MQLGISLYSFNRALESGALTAADAVRKAAEFGAAHMELVDFCLPQDAAGLNGLRAALAETGLSVSALSTGAEVLQTGEAYTAELARVCGRIDAARSFGAPVVRIDLVGWEYAYDTCTIELFQRDLPRLAAAAQHFADYAKPLGITITVENHGMFINGGDRVRQLITTVNRDNYRCTLDIGNSLCVDEDALVCTRKLLPYAAAVHAKDFYVRRADDARFRNREAAGWFTSVHGTLLRGAITGDGEVDIPAVIAMLRGAGYDGTLALEFEGMEDCLLGSRAGLANLRAMLKG